MTISLKQITVTSVLLLGMQFAASSISAAQLVTQVFNPGAKSLFPVTSTLVTGPTEAVLIDAQFQRDDAESVLQMIKDSGKELTTIYISHGDPDFYFALEVISAAYPEAKIVTSRESRQHIEKTVKGKVAYWGPILGKNAPQTTIIPDVLLGDTIEIDGEELNIVGLKGKNPAHTFVWIPSLKTVAGGVLVYDQLHVWMADNQTQESLRLWQESLQQLLALEPNQVIPGHYLGASSYSTASVNFTQNYINRFSEAARNTKTSVELIAKMKALYPGFENLKDLALSAKVISGEIQWP